MAVVQICRNLRASGMGASRTGILVRFSVGDGTAGFMLGTIHQM
jgi:hypothetical protein